jgi:hypothetical protein
MRNPAMDGAESRAEQGSPILGAWALIRSLAPYFRPYRLKLAAIALGLILEMAFNTAFPLSLKFLIDGALIDRDHRVLALILTLLGGGVVIASAAGLARDYLYASINSQQMTLARMVPLKDFKPGFYDIQVMIKDNVLNQTITTDKEVFQVK